MIRRAAFDASFEGSALLRYYSWKILCWPWELFLTLIWSFFSFLKWLSLYRLCNCPKILIAPFELIIDFTKIWPSSLLRSYLSGSTGLWAISNLSGFSIILTLLTSGPYLFPSVKISELTSWPPRPKRFLLILSYSSFVLVSWSTSASLEYIGRFIPARVTLFSPGKHGVL